MADSHANLTNNGLTTNFDVSYDNSIDRQANVIDNANALLACCRERIHRHNRLVRRPGRQVRH